MIDTVMELDNDDEQLGIEKDVPIKYFYIDIRMIYLKRKLRLICKERDFEWMFTENDDGFGMYDVAKFLRKVNKYFGLQIEEQKEVRSAIDSIFYDTCWVIKLQLVIYFLFFFIPFFVQLRDVTVETVRTCLASCMIVQMFLLFNELLQMFTLRKAYFKLFNLLELLQFAAFMFYFKNRWRDPEMKMIPVDNLNNHLWNKEDPIPINKTVFFVFFNSFILLTTVGKLLYFMKVYEQFCIMV